jgi:hypothetical protein
MSSLRPARPGCADAAQKKPLPLNPDLRTIQRHGSRGQVTSNVIESSFATVRQRTDRTKGSRALAEKV